MNNRYLYRAKRIDNGELVTGNLIQNPFFKGVRSWISSEQEDKTRLRSISRTQALWNSIEVDSSTICQCTGLNDKNGNLIWENDICRRILLPTKRIKTIFRIAYVPYKCCLSAIDLDGSNVTFLSDYINNQYEVEVIGNIFDNPELLEVGE